MTTTDEQQFMRAICAEPGDDMSRLVFADFLEENGQAERAEWIRVQIALTQPIECKGWGCRKCTSPAVKVPSFREEDCGCRFNEKRNALERREQELRQPNAFEWFAIPGLFACSVWDHSPTVRWHDGDESNDVMGGDTSRGFISSITLPCADFMRHAGAIFQSQPIGRVVLSDKRPVRWNRWFAWYCGSQRPDLPNATIPEEIGQHLDGQERHGPWDDYRTEQAALDALSVACVRWGREAAGLEVVTCE